MNLNVIVVASNAAPYVELGIGIVSLAYLHAVSVWVLFGIKRNPNYTIAGVLAWAIGYVYAELKIPYESIVARFDETTINGVGLAAVIVSGIITVQILFRFFMYVVEKYNEKYANVVKEVHDQEEKVDSAGAEEKQEEAAADDNV